jgi:hypothetical protein
MCFDLFNLSYIDGYGSHYGVKQILCYVAKVYLLWVSFWGVFFIF